MTINQWVKSSSIKLEEAGCDSPALDSQLIVGHVLGQDRSWVMAHGDDDFLNPDAEKLLERRLTREPLAYILGKKEFFGHEFSVDSRVLIPRPETELVVARAILWQNETGEPTTVLDIGTGSGCIAISIALEHSNAEVYACDISADALEVAHLNATKFGTDIEFSQSNLVSAFSGQAFDLVVSNPPYVAHSDELSPEIREFEPETALYAQANGYEFYRRLAHEAIPITKQAIIIEIGAGMEENIKSIFTEFDWQHTETLLDLASIPRCMTFIPPQ